MVRRYCPEIADATYYGSAGVTGEVIRWGVEAGAAVADMDAFQGHGAYSPESGSFITYAVVTGGGIFVNARGERFTDETHNASGLALDVLRQPGGVAIEVFDQPLYELGRRFPDFERAVARGAVKRAETLADLATDFGLDPDVLQATLDRYHRAVEAGVDELGRSRFGEPLEPPFYGVRITGALFHTQGGLAVDRHARVCDTQGEPIPNLYAGGGAARGVSGPGGNGYWPGNGLLTAFAYGRIAGEHAARTLEVRAV
jgi:fumarate reductase flavoprotein subunit